MWMLHTGFDGASNQWKKFKSTKTIYLPSYLPDHGELENPGFFSVAQMVRVSHAFVCNAVDVNNCLFWQTETLNWLDGWLLL